MEKRIHKTFTPIVMRIGLVVLVITLLGWGLIDAIHGSQDAQVMVRQSHQAQRAIAALQRTLALAESDQRGFLLTGNAQFQTTRDAALERLQQDVAAIGEAPATNAGSHASNQQLALLIAERIATMRKPERIRTADAIAEASHAFAGRLPEQANVQLDTLVTRLAREEDRRLEARQQMVLQGEAVVRRMLMLAGLAIIAIMLALLWGIRRQSRDRHQAEMRLRAIAHSVPGAVYVYRLGPSRIGSFEFVSVNARKVLGIGRKQILKDGQAVLDLVLEEDRERLNAAMARSASELSPLEVDVRIRKADEVIRWVRSSAIPAHQADGDLVWNGYWFDITDIKQAEQALRDAMQRLEHAQGVAGIGDWTCDLATGAVSWSPQVYLMLKRDPALPSLDLGEWASFFENGAEIIADAFFKAQESGLTQSYELTALLSDGNIATFHVIAVPALDQNGVVNIMHGTIQDITSRKALEARLSHAKEAADIANRAKGDFLATMSHEIRTPLTGMLGYLELINLMPQNPEMRSALEGVRESGNSLQRIIDDILDFSKVEAGKLEIRLEPTRVVDAISSLHRIHAGMANSRGLALHYSVEPEVSAVVMIDEFRLRQILGNLLSNATKFTPEGRIDLRVQLLASDGERQQLRFQVEDSGIGISPERQQRLFHPFEQAEEDIATRFGGTGLGLSISRRLAELMGGTVTMRSEVGKGTTMNLDMWVKVSDQQPMAIVQHVKAMTMPQSLPKSVAMPQALGNVDIDSPAPTALDGRLILVVDDHPINRMLMRRQLNAIGYAAEDFESGAQALEQWKTGRFALVLTDCNMPEMSGYQLSRHIRDAEAERGSERTPIIACSANVMGGVHQDCLDAGMDDYISKPTELTILAEKVGAWLPTSKPNSTEPDRSSTQNGPTPDSGVPLAARAIAKESLANNDTLPSRRVLDHFRKVNDADVLKLAAAVGEHDMTQIAHLAHRIKGACGFIGATHLASVCAMIEQAGNKNDESAIDWLMGLFHGELEQLNARLDAA